MERHFYERYEELQRDHWWFVGRRRIFGEAFARFVPANTGSRILDYGCGPGTFLPQLRELGRVSAVDMDEQAIQFCRSRGWPDVQLVESGSSLPFADHEFDLVTAFDVIEHIEDDVAALHELRRVTKSTGRLLISVPAFGFLWGDQDVISRHKRRYTAKSLRRALHQAGLEIEHLTYFNTVMFPVVAIVRCTRRVIRHPQSDKTDFDIGPAWLNRTLGRAFGAEAPWVARRRLPVGVSLLAVARRP
jgi:SAM-dependent methyltransferase